MRPSLYVNFELKFMLAGRAQHRSREFCVRMLVERPTAPNRHHIFFEWQLSQPVQGGWHDRRVSTTDRTQITMQHAHCLY